MSRAIAAIFALLILAVGGGYALEASLENAGDDTLIVNESWTPNAGSITVLNESERGGAYYSNQTTVYDENGTLMDRGDDYLWFQNNGTVQAVVGGNLDGDSSALITYEYQQTTAEQRGFAGMLSNIPGVLGWIFPVFIFLIALRFLAG